jgi:hypothetical protein
MSRLSLAILFLGLCVALPAWAQEEEAVRINIKQDVLTISASQTIWWLSHGWGIPAVSDTVGWTEEQVRDFQLCHLLFGLVVDGVPQAPDEVTYSIYTPPGDEPVWVVDWVFTKPFAPGIHVLEGTWSILGLPCEYYDYEPCCCRPDSSENPFGIVVLENEVRDGLLTQRNRHTLTLIVLP